MLYLQPRDCPCQLGRDRFAPIVGPFAARVKGVIEEDHQFYMLIREVLVAALHNHSPDICVEVGRQNTPRGLRPSFSDLSDALREAKVA